MQVFIFVRGGYIFIYVLTLLKLVLGLYNYLVFLIISLYYMQTLHHKLLIPSVISRMAYLLFSYFSGEPKNCFDLHLLRCCSLSINGRAFKFQLYTTKDVLIGMMNGTLNLTYAQLNKMADKVDTPLREIRNVSLFQGLCTYATFLGCEMKTKNINFIKFYNYYYQISMNSILKITILN